MSKANSKSSKAKEQPKVEKQPQRRSARLAGKERKTYYESSDESSEDEAEDPTITVKNVWMEYMQEEQIFFVKGYYQYLIMLVLLKPLMNGRYEICIVFICIQQTTKHKIHPIVVTV